MKHFFLVLLLFPLLAVGQKKTWKLVWSDEFNYTGLPDSAKWKYDVGGHGWGNNEMQFYTANRKENARVENGLLTIEARKENWEGKSYTSARLVTKGSGDWQYGKIEVKAKIPKGRGTWPRSGCWDQIRLLTGPMTAKLTSWSMSVLTRVSSMLPSIAKNIITPSARRKRIQFL